MEQLEHHDAQPPGSALRRWPNYEAAAIGLREYWYPVMPSRKLGRKKMSAARIAGRELCLLRENGKIYVLENQCPHRGIPLSMGSREFPGHVACIYHGWVFDVTDGELKHALPDGPDSPIRGTLCVRTFPAEERLGMIWVWTGDGDPVPLDDDLPEEFLDPAADIFWRQSDSPGNWRYAVENGFDESHGKVLHRNSWWLFFNRMSAWNDTEITRSEDGKWLRRYQRKIVVQADYPGLGQWPRFNFFQRRRKTVQQGSNSHAVDVRLPATLRVRQPGNANWTHYEWYVPIDDSHYRYTQVAVAWATGFQRLMWRLRYWTYILWVHHYGFNNQDLMVVPLQNPLKAENLFRPDVSVTAWRRFADREHRRPSPETKAQNTEAAE
jgi:phenylpropionate dioxygenase-like ring-hydroxylating dioxygenase large terminal subunit